jgi:hypothetical protein
MSPKNGIGPTLNGMVGSKAGTVVEVPVSCLNIGRPWVEPGRVQGIAAALTLLRPIPSLKAVLNPDRTPLIGRPASILLKTALNWTPSCGACTTYPNFCQSCSMRLLVIGR